MYLKAGKHCYFPKHLFKRKQSDRPACSIQCGYEPGEAMKYMVFHVFHEIHDEERLFNYRIVNGWRLNHSSESPINACLITHCTQCADTAASNTLLQGERELMLSTLLHSIHVAFKRQHTPLSLVLRIPLTVAPCQIFWLIFK